MDPRFDDLLNTVITEKGQGIYGFFDVMFSFLYRRTDFFYEMAPGENMGFFPSQAEAIVCGYFRKYQQLHFKERVPKRKIDPKVIDEYLKKQKEKGKQPAQPPIQPSPPSSQDQTIPPSQQQQQPSQQQQPQQPTTTNTTTSPSSAPTQPTKPPQKPIENKPISISTYNGDVCDKYNWSQGVSDVTIQFPLPEAVSKKMLDISMTVNHLKITIKSKEPKVLIDDDFCEKIKPDDSNWTLEDGQSLVFYLEKAGEVIWKSAFKGGKEIDTKKVDNSKRIDEFDNETQAALNKIMYEQNRKRNGLPTTEEEQKLEQLKQAWNQPGSPFAGQPFDPSMFNLNEPIYYNTPDYEAKLRAKKEQEAQTTK